MNNTGNKRAPTTATQRLKQDYLRIKKDPVPYICAEPLPSNILEWHYVVRGPEKTPYEGGYYHGKLIFPREFPFKPPSIYMITPNGRFKCNTRLPSRHVEPGLVRVHHPHWTPELHGRERPDLGSIETSDFTKRQLSAQSLAFNLKDKVFCELFPDVVDEMKQKQKTHEELSCRTQPLPLPDVVPDGDPQQPTTSRPKRSSGAPRSPQQQQQQPPGPPQPGQPQPRTARGRAGQPVRHRRLRGVRLHGQVRSPEHSAGVSPQTDQKERINLLNHHSDFGNI
ncbi:hypothetical protein WMY93_033054 [Mugilogobius chulae]|uniref:UBC core domain-containing protein n=1 Tax=Mugilogobius chulae TaxID=88201 RepID=A0AAW0MLF0_9GOBI